MLLISWSGWILKNLCLCFYSPDHLSLVPGQILLAGQVREFWNYLHVLALVDFRFLHCSSLFIFSSPRSAEPHGSLWDKVILFSLTPWMFRQPTIFPSIFLWALILCNVCIIVALCYVANMVICNHTTTRPTPEATFVRENLKPTCAIHNVHGTQEGSYRCSNGNPLTNQFLSALSPFCKMYEQFGFFLGGNQ